MYLLTEGLRHFEKLPEALQADLRTQLGWPYEKEEVLAASPPVEDEWSVLGQSYREREKLWERRTWLRGETSGQMALVLDFSHGNRNFPVSMAAGTRFRGSLAFYPAAFALRALLVSEPTGAHPLAQPFAAATDFQTALGNHSEALAVNPWAVTLPLAVNDVTPVRRGDAWFLRDSTGAEVPMRMPELEAWTLLALSGGQPIRAFGEWSGGAWQVLSAWTGEFQTFQSAS